MALSSDELQQLGAFVGQVVDQKLAGFRQEQAETAAADRTSKVGIPDVDPDAGPDYYVHLADGSVVKSKDANSTHMPAPGTGLAPAGETVAVTGRFQVQELSLPPLR